MNADPNDRLAKAYFKVLSSIDWADPLVVAGLQEGLRKFLSNAHIALFPNANKYHKTHLVTPRALEQLERRQRRDLVWEHLVPKTGYIQEPCESHARNGTLTVEFISDLLKRYWRLATITKEEDRILHATRMPITWDLENVLARYEDAGIVLVRNPFFDDLVAWEPIVEVEKGSIAGALP